MEYKKWHLVGQNVDVMSNVLRRDTIISTLLLSMVTF
jgi:hypothetical protein